MNDAETILDGVMQGHAEMVKQFKGTYVLRVFFFFLVLVFAAELRCFPDVPFEFALVSACLFELGSTLMCGTVVGVPGALPDRLKEASVIKHCAMSLVGEPIM
jgi:hypothetical protein